MQGPAQAGRSTTLPAAVPGLSTRQQPAPYRDLGMRLLGIHICWAYEQGSHICWAYKHPRFPHLCAGLRPSQDVAHGVCRAGPRAAGHAAHGGVQGGGREDAGAQLEGPAAGLLPSYGRLPRRDSTYPANWQRGLASHAVSLGSCPCCTFPELS